MNLIVIECLVGNLPLLYPCLDSVAHKRVAYASFNLLDDAQLLY
jgi:hypothetical protein